MTRSTQFIRVIASCAMLFIATSVFAQYRHTLDGDVAHPDGGGEMAPMSKCPVMGTISPAAARHTAAGAMSNRYGWPTQLNLNVLHQSGAVQQLL